MVNQDPHFGSFAGDSGHGTVVVTLEAEPINNNEGLIGAIGGMDENISGDIDGNASAEYLSGVEWKEDDLLIEIEDENVTIPQTPATASTLVQSLAVDKLSNPWNHPLKRSHASVN